MCLFVCLCVQPVLSSKDYACTILNKNGFCLFYLHTCAAVCAWNGGFVCQWRGAGWGYSGGEHPFFFFFFEAVLLVVFMYHVFTCMPGESYCRQLRSLLCLWGVFWALINSLGCRFPLGSVKNVTLHQSSFCCGMQECFWIWCTLPFL